MQLESAAWQLLCSCHSQQPTGGHAGSGSLTTAAASSGSQMPPPPVPLQLRGRDVAPPPPRARGQQPTGGHSGSGSLTTAAAGYQTLGQASDLPTLVKQDSPQDGGSLATARIAASHWSDTSTTIASASTSFFFLQVLFEGFVVVQPGSTKFRAALLYLLHRWTCPKICRRRGSISWNMEHGKKEAQSFRRPSSWKQHWSSSGSRKSCTATQAKIRQRIRSMGQSECLAESIGTHYNT